MIRILILAFVAAGVASYRVSNLVTRYSTSLAEARQRHTSPLSPTESAALQRKRVTSTIAGAIIGLLGVAQAGNAKSIKQGEYLREPTEGFKSDVALTKAENAREAKERAAWDKLFTKFEESKTSAELEESLKALVAFLTPLDGIPSGFSKRELVKRCRARKNMDIGKRKPVPKPEWTKEVEIQYQALTRLWNSKTTYNL